VIYHKIADFEIIFPGFEALAKLRSFVFGFVISTRPRNPIHGIKC
jgi:hypothetical protein